ncbi:hypothetical protein DSO57_1015050 [Entomophthora muscae]|uniref:Uncharacterized protein n=1 Tax=Entomophthora muscae TaxID=34485 RepID=A0ACC2TSG7_9FUNG|nr:hypothetical protein DSO57_1015050 [Entomophthora muscae]
MRTFYFLSSLLAIESKLHLMEWVVEEQLMAPDNHAITGMTINRQFPGPTLTLDMGDSVEIKVHNKISHSLTIHWHGILQKNTPKANGVPFVTQDPIPVNENCTYKFSVNNQSGTYWYHAHTMLDSEVVFGALIINEPKAILDKAIQLDISFQYDDERTLLLFNIFHKPMDQVYQGLVTAPFTQSPDPMSIITNGGTYEEWDDPADPHIPFNNGYSVINVNPNTRYRLRIIASQGHSYYALHIPNHRFTVIEADGTLVKPFQSNYVYINSGQRYSAILQTNNSTQNYFIHTSIVGEVNDLNNGVAILHYKGAPTPQRKKLHIPIKKHLQMTSWFEDQLSTLITQEYTVPYTYTQSIFLKLQFKQQNGLLRFELNDVSNNDRNRQFSQVS